MNNLSYLIVWCLFAGIIYVGFDIQKQIKSNKEAETRRIEDEAAARVLAEQKRLEDLDKIRVQIVHDNDPQTNTYSGRLQAIAVDEEDDEISYLWEQVDVSPDIMSPDANLSSPTESTTYFKAPAGEYRFQLTITDAYGNATTESQVIIVEAEPNEAPTVGIKVDAGSEPSNPFDIVHDRDPETGLFNVKLGAVGSDPENDKFSYNWEQIPVSPSDNSFTPVTLTGKKQGIKYFKAPEGEYRFQLTMTDAYGASDVTNQLIVIKGEPNNAPTVEFKVTEGVEPIDPFEGDIEKIKEFQKKAGLEADGIWGKKSQEAWKKAKEAELEQKKKDREERKKKQAERQRPSIDD